MSSLLTSLRSLYMAIVQLLKKPFTVKYHTENEERIPEYDRGRGELIMNLPECIGCGICVNTCPNKALELRDFDNENPKNRKKKIPHLNLGMCSFCALCADECPYGVLEMGKVHDRAYLTMKDMHRSPEKMYEEWKEQKGVQKEEENI